MLQIKLNMSFFNAILKCHFNKQHKANTSITYAVKFRQEC